MEPRKVYLAVDLGAESGRVVAGLYDGSRLELEEVHRFPNVPVEDRDSLRLDVEGLFDGVKTGMTIAARRYAGRLASIGVDTWAVDYGLVDEQNRLLDIPHHYRDPRILGMRDKVNDMLGRRRIFDASGIQFLPFNTLYQLAAEVEDPDTKIHRADALLLMPDLMNLWLTGHRLNERTNASTTQFYNPRTKDWATSLLEAIGVPTSILGEIADPGTRLGPVLPAVADQTGVGPLEVVLPGTHDTASAVAGVPAKGDRWAFLSSGTWSILGVEVEDPVVTTRSYELGLGNEIGVYDSVRLLKNTSGLWLVQQCRATWEAQGESYSYSELTRMAGDAPPFTAMIDPDDDTFLPRGDMPARIDAYCEGTGQRPPKNKGALLRTIFESLALRYRSILEGLEEVVGHRVDTLHIVGGGSQNELLNQFTANAIDRNVVVGPVEATAVGNIIVQMLALGDVASLQDGRNLIRQSSDLATYQPIDEASWNDAFARFQALT